MARLPLTPYPPDAAAGVPSSATTQSPEALEPAMEPHSRPRPLHRGRSPQPTKRRKVLHTMHDELGELVERDEEEVKKLGWNKFVKQRTGRGEFTDLTRVKHPARRLLRQYGARGVPVMFSSAPWDKQQVETALRRGPHKSAREYNTFLREEFAEMVRRGHWTVLPYRVAKTLPGLRLSPLGVVPQRDRRPRTIADYSFYGVNRDTLPIAPDEAMQYGRALDRIIRQVVRADPKHGPVHLIKVDLADGFYRIGVTPHDIPKLAVVFPDANPLADTALDDRLVALPLRVPMGWTSSPPFFCAATETIADLANQNILRWRNPPPHRLEEAASTLPSPDKTHPPSALPFQQTDQERFDIPRDPTFSVRNSRPVGEIDIFVDDFIGCAQGDTNRLNRIRRILLHAIDMVFRPLDNLEVVERKEVASVKKLLKGDACWTTCKNVLGWIIDTTAMTLHLPQRRLDRLAEILSEIPRSQRRTSVQKWYRILGELRSMSLALPGSRGLFSALQLALQHHPENHRVRLSKGVHDALDDFRLLHRDLGRRPTRLYELVPSASPAVVGMHDASGEGAGGVLFPAPHASVRGQANGSRRPVVWRAAFPDNVRAQLVSYTNPHGTINNSELELAGSLLQHEAAVQNFDVAERTVLSYTDNTAALYWQRKGSVTTDGPTAYLLRAQALHQRKHRYLARHDYLPGPDNTLADAASRLCSLDDSHFLQHFNTHYPQKESWQLWKVPPATLSAVTLSLHRQRYKPEWWLKDPPPTTAAGKSGPASVTNWPSTPLSQESLTQSRTYKYLRTGTAPVHLHHMAGQSELAQWKVPYGQLARRPAAWGPGTRGSRSKGRRTFASSGN